MDYVSRIMYQVSRVRCQVSRLNPDTLIGLTLFLAGFYAYASTLAPTVLEGDAALFQYTPYVLGVTYPTGYPLYILLGKLWLTLFPWGEIAWRMNLFSAFCSAAALPLIYGAARQLLIPAISPTQYKEMGADHSLLLRIAALTTVLTFATLPTFWRWSTEAKIYALNILLFSGVLYTLALACAQNSMFNVQRSTLHASRLTLHASLSTSPWLYPPFCWAYKLVSTAPRCCLSLACFSSPGFIYAHICSIKNFLFLISYFLFSRACFTCTFPSGLSG